MFSAYNQYYNTKPIYCQTGLEAEPTYFVEHGGATFLDVEGNAFHLFHRGHLRFDETRTEKNCHPNKKQTHNLRKHDTY